MIGTTRDEHEQNLEQTAAALESGITGLTIDTALSIVDRWHSEVVTEDDMDLSDVAAGLEELRGLLSADSLDGAAIGETMVRLGESTQIAAQQAADERMTPLLERLATLLSRAGNLLSGGRERSTADEPHQGRD